MDAGANVNLRALTRANELRREAMIFGDCPILHKAADVEMSRVINADRDERLLRSAQERAARARKPYRVTHYGDALKNGEFRTFREAVVRVVEGVLAGCDSAGYQLYNSDLTDEGDDGLTEEQSDYYSAELCDARAKMRGARP